MLGAENQTMCRDIVHRGSVTLRSPGDCADCVNDDRPYSTKLVVPINLQDGVYVLQMWATGVGQASPHSYSCADLDISGGDTSIPAETNPLTSDNVTTVLDTCWSCWKDNPGTTACRPPHLVEGGFGFKWGEFAFPSEPIVKKPKKKLIGYAPHELGMGDTLLGIAKVYQCCCTPEDIAVTTGWGGTFAAVDGASARIRPWARGSLTSVVVRACRRRQCYHRDAVPNTDRRQEGDCALLQRSQALHTRRSG